MTTTTAVSSSANAFENLNKARDAKTQTQETQDRFLKLLITQLKSQDPMNPVDSAQSTTQMAQMSMVSGIENLNASMTSMMTTFNAGQSFQAAGLIGKQVLVEGDTLQYDGKKAVSAEIEVPTDGSTVKVGVYNANNQKVDEIELGKLKAGRQAIEWDGTDASGKALPAGKYYLAGEALQPDGSNKMMKSFTYVGVNSVALDAGNVNVKLSDGRTLPYSAVTSIM